MIKCLYFLFVGAVASVVSAGQTLAGDPARSPEPVGSGWTGEAGTASYYGPSFHGRLAADGRPFDQMALTAAHPWLPFGTKVKVILATSGRTVIVTITDRLPYSKRIVDLSLGAARQLGMLRCGIAQVSLLPV